MTESDLQALVAAMEHPLLLDRGGGVHYEPTGSVSCLYKKVNCWNT